MRALYVFKKDQKDACHALCAAATQKGHTVEIVRDWDKVLVLVK